MRTLPARCDGFNRRIRSGLTMESDEVVSCPPRVHKKAHPHRTALWREPFRTDAERIIGEIAQLMPPNARPAAAHVSCGRGGRVGGRLIPIAESRRVRKLVGRRAM